VAKARPVAERDDARETDPSDDALFWWAALFIVLNGVGIVALLVMLLPWFTVGLFR